MPTNNYHSKIDKRYTVKLRVLERQLPYYCTQYFNAKAHVLEKQSQFAYATDFRIFFEFIKGHLSEYEDTDIRNIPAEMFNTLTSHDINAYLSYLEYYVSEGDHRHNGENGIQRKLSSIKSLCKYLLKEEMIYKNPTELVEMPKLHKRDIVTLTDKEIQKLFYIIENSSGMTDFQAAINTSCVYRDYAIMMLFLGTGMRISELVGLDLQDINLKNNSARIIRKGGNEQHVYFSPQVSDALKRYLGNGSSIDTKGTRATLKPDPDEKALFISRKKNRLTVRAVQKLIEKYSKLAFGEDSENKLHAHLFRKTYGTKLYLDTNDIKLVADTLGHSSISTTEKHYVKNSEEHKKKAAMDVLH